MPSGPAGRAVRARAGTSSAPRRSPRTAGTSRPSGAWARSGPPPERAPRGPPRSTRASPRSRARRRRGGPGRHRRGSASRSSPAENRATSPSIAATSWSAPVGFSNHGNRPCGRRQTTPRPASSRASSRNWFRSPSGSCENQCHSTTPANGSGGCRLVVRPHQPCRNAVGVGDVLDGWHQRCPRPSRSRSMALSMRRCRVSGVFASSMPSTNQRFSL